MVGKLFTSYRHTIIVVSHDRSFLNEVCTDTIEFKKKKLTYFKGDYDTYVKTSHEMVKNQMRVYQVSSILFCFDACWLIAILVMNTSFLYLLPIGIPRQTCPHDGVYRQVSGKC